MTPREIAELGVAMSEMPPGTLWCIGSMEDGPFARIVYPQPNGGYSNGYFEAEDVSPAEALRAALARARAPHQETQG